MALSFGLLLSEPLLGDYIAATNYGKALTLVMLSLAFGYFVSYGIIILYRHFGILIQY